MNPGIYTTIQAAVAEIYYY